ncbi:MAG: glycerol-3-phosphate dehydrogenase [Thalassospira sp.]|uniref:glycerol-3-phosphate dehydrogenase n=1 Tax=Thalassospira sp. TaxID=1912094 RepID=UPI001B00017D|nr:glycerol-3-phosphate dehydrogenase [Thalassospira sp.]MBO6578097.1 glycerol-3-phosphate dehydrogenase [Thalassospira sp.]MBO6818207.1 glycerol-3-phosphate dehydrogenase [Thalassospira sp.]MBO6887977.1 glycerol-3-phosphate dehydrogenase [Thalassospira sp.]
MTGTYDLLVVGGGINGAGIARDAAGRGLSVLLVEQRDLASATSSSSTKLIHGGLRYLEHYEFRLVREALQEREVLLAAAPHIIWPLTFVLPHHRGLRPKWMLRAGLFLYDHLAKRKRLPGSRAVSFNGTPEGQPLKSDYAGGFSYSDCWVDDARLVVLNAQDAQARGADIRTRTRCASLVRHHDHWNAELIGPDGTPQSVSAKSVVNAAGPWVTEMVENAGLGKKAAGLRLVKGSHIVVARIHDHDHCYIFQNGDGRIAFAIPYQQDYTLIGTTDVTYNGDPAQVKISDQEVDYLLDLVNGYLDKPLNRKDVVWDYSGVRPLYDDKNDNASAVTRDYVFDLDTGDSGSSAPILSIYGGKITTYRKLAEHAMQKLAPVLSNDAKDWTANAILPGGDMPDGDFDAFLAKAKATYDWLPRALLYRLVRSYGTAISKIIGTATSLGDLGTEVAPNLYEAELKYLMANEWACRAEDVLWRRTKLGLGMQPDQVDAIEKWFAAQTRLDRAAQ